MSNTLATKLAIVNNALDKWLREYLFEKLYGDNHNNSTDNPLNFLKARIMTSKDDSTILEEITSLSHVEYTITNLIFRQISIHFTGKLNDYILTIADDGTSREVIFLRASRDITRTKTSSLRDYIIKVIK